AKRSGGDAAGLLLFVGGFAHVGDAHVEVQGLARQRVVAVDADLAVADRDHGHQHRALAAVGLELHARLDAVDALERLARHVLHQAFDALAIGLGRRHVDGQRLAGATAFQRLLQAGDDVAAAVEIAERMVFRRTVQDLACVVGEDVVERGHAGGGDLHGSAPWYWKRKGGLKWMAARTGGLTVPRLPPTLTAAAATRKPRRDAHSGGASLPLPGAAAQPASRRSMSSSFSRHSPFIHCWKQARKARSSW